MDQQDKTNVERIASQRRTALAIAAIAGVVAMILIGVLVVNYMYGKVVEPVLSDELAEWKLLVAEQPENEKVLSHVRELDLKLRQITFRRLDRTRKGSLLLLCALGVLFIVLKYEAGLSEKLPHPQGATDMPETQELKAFWARRAVTIAMVVVSIGAIAVFVRPSPDFTDAAASLENAGGSASEPLWPSLEEIGRNWATFRGPGGLGVRATGDYPVSVEGKVIWETPVPLASMSSPVVWGNRIFLTGADEQQRQVYCYDAVSGAMLWTGDVPGVNGDEIEPMEDTGFAAPTPVTNGKYVCAIFATGDIGCFDFEGKRVWAKNLGTPDSVYGYASSLTMFQDKVIVQYDQGYMDDGLSKLIALDFATCNIAWQKNRPVSSSWASPTVVEVGDKSQLLTSADPFVIAYDSADGSELWRAECVAGDVAPTQIFSEGLVLAVEPYSHMVAIRPGGTGDVTETHIAWRAEDSIPDICSPVSDGKQVFLLTTEGSLTCYDIADGKLLWEHDLDANYQTSPCMIGGKMYLLSDKGQLLVAAVDGEFSEVARSEIGQGCYASPAFVDGRIYIRTVENLYCIGDKD